jgi:hypothetical protein
MTLLEFDCYFNSISRIFILTSAPVIISRAILPRMCVHGCHAKYCCNALKI